MKHIYLAAALIIGLVVITITGVFIEVLTGSEALRIIWCIVAGFELGRRACKAALGEYL